MSEFWQTICAVMLSVLIAVAFAYGGEYYGPYATTPEAINSVFDRLGKETCAGPNPYRYVAGDFLTKQSLELNTDRIIEAIRKGGCKVKVKK